MGLSDGGANRSPARGHLSPVGRGSGAGGRAAKFRDSIPGIPSTFDLDSAVTSLPMVFALVDGTHADTVQSELVVGHTQILFRERIGGVFLADTSRLSTVDYQLVMRARARSGQALLDRIHEDVRARPPGRRRSS